MGEVTQAENVAFFAPHATYVINWGAKAVSYGPYKAHCFLKEKLSYVNGDHATCYYEMAQDQNISLHEPNTIEELGLRFTHLLSAGHINTFIRPLIIILCVS